MFKDLLNEISLRIIQFAIVASMYTTDLQIEYTDIESHLEEFDYFVTPDC